MDGCRVACHGAALEFAVLGRAQRTDDLIARLGGDEFSALLPDTDSEGVLIAAERIRRRITSLIVTVNTDKGPATVDELSCSVGAATYPDAGPTLDALLLAADTALYQAKNAGRNAIRSAPVLSGPDANAAAAEEPDDPTQSGHTRRRPAVPVRERPTPQTPRVTERDGTLA